MKNFRDYLKENTGLTDEQKEKEKWEKDGLKIKESAFKVKVDDLNHIIHGEGVKDFSFHFENKEDHYEFDIPFHVLFGPLTREFCAKRWKEVMAKANIEMDFTDEIHSMVEKMSGFKVVMKVNKSLTHEQGNGTVEGTK